MQEIVELHQDGIAAHLFRRHEAGWLSIEVIGADQTLTLESLGIEIPLADLYANVRFEPHRVGMGSMSKYGRSGVVRGVGGG